jgi:hypothetical protein
MAQLSRFLSGIILPYDTFGWHLNTQGVTIDIDLEKENFNQAGLVLSEIWSEAVIDSYPVLAEWWGGETLSKPQNPTQEWLDTHLTIWDPVNISSRLSSVIMRNAVLHSDHVFCKYFIAGWWKFSNSRKEGGCFCYIILGEGGTWKHYITLHEGGGARKWFFCVV